MSGNALEILIVDDNPGDLELIREGLADSMLPLNVTTAGNGVDAMTLVEADTASPFVPDFVMMDLNMPRLDGRQLIARLRDRPEFKNTPVVVFTTSQSHDDVTLTYMNGANCFLTKPIDLDDFLGRIRAIERFWLQPLFAAKNGAEVRA